MACRMERGSSPLLEIVTLGAAEMELREVAEVERISEEEVDEEGAEEGAGPPCCCCCCCCGVLGEAP